MAWGLAALPAGCGEGAWNNPYPAEEEGKNILYSAFTEPPKHLDPVQSYSSNEYAFLQQIVEPPLQYHFLKRPFHLEPLTATEMPRPVYADAGGRPLPDGAPDAAVAWTLYDVRIRPGIRYEPHPAFATDEAGRPRYRALAAGDVAAIFAISDFPHAGTRELTASDYVFQIRRLAHPRLHSPLFGLMSGTIAGLGEYGEALRKAVRPGAYLDLEAIPFEGAVALDRYTYRLKIRGKYPQMLYWLAMPFFSPVPPEVDRFYAQPALVAQNVTLDAWPVGTGPFRMAVNNPNRQIILERNPHYRGDPYPSEGEPGDAAAGLLADAGKPMPFADRVVYTLEKESIPHWYKFLQGYYDLSGISADSFDQAVRIGTQGEAALSDAMRERGISLTTEVEPTIYYLGFNMLDPLVGGDSGRARALRQAVSIAVDYEEFVSIFRNGRGVPAHGPIPPGLFGHEEGEAGMNPIVYDWADGAPRRKPVEAAKRLLAEAGWPGGRDAVTGAPLTLHFDTATGGPEDKALMDWFRKQLRKIDVSLEVRETDYNRFQDKMLNGNAQMFIWGWHADYPDPENFLFLLQGSQGKARHQGENASNYASAAFDERFERMRSMPDGPERLALIREMTSIVRRDAPWVWGFHPKQFVLHHAWYGNAKPNALTYGTVKYKRVDAGLRARRRAGWNRPVAWPLAAAAGALALAALPAIAAVRRRERRVGR